MFHMLIIIYFINFQTYIYYSVIFEIIETVKYKIYHITSNHRMPNINKMRHGNSLLTPYIPFRQEEHVNLFIPFNIMQ